MTRTDRRVGPATPGTQFRLTLLAGVGDAGDGNRLGVLVDDDRALAAEFERDVGDVASGVPRRQTRPTAIGRSRPATLYKKFIMDGFLLSGDYGEHL